MKYLVTARRNSTQSLSEAEFKEVSQAPDWINRLQKEGKLEQWYHFAEQTAFVSIWNVNSNEELFELLFTSPFAFHASFDVHPLVSLDTWTKMLKQVEAQFSGKVPAGVGR